MKKYATTEEKLIKKLQTRGKSAFRILRSAEAPLLEYKRGRYETN